MLQRVSREMQAISDMNTFYFGVWYPILLPCESQMCENFAGLKTAHKNLKHEYTNLNNLVWIQLTSNFFRAPRGLHGLSTRMSCMDSVQAG